MKLFPLVNGPGVVVDPVTTVAPKAYRSSISKAMVASVSPKVSASAIAIVVPTGIFFPPPVGSNAYDADTVPKYTGHDCAIKIPRAELYFFTRRLTPLLAGLTLFQTDPVGAGAV